MSNKINRKSKMNATHLTAEAFLKAYTNHRILQALEAVAPGPEAEEVWKRKVRELTSGAVLPDHEMDCVHTFFPKRPVPLYVCAFSWNAVTNEATYYFLCNPHSSTLFTMAETRDHSKEAAQRFAHMLQFAVDARRPQDVQSGAASSEPPAAREQDNDTSGALFDKVTDAEGNEYVRLTPYGRTYWRRRKAKTGATTGSNRQVSNESKPS